MLTDASRVLLLSISYLVVEFFEVLWCAGVGIRCRVVLHPPSLLQQQSAQPAVLACSEYASAFERERRTPMDRVSDGESYGATSSPWSYWM